MTVSYNLDVSSVSAFSFFKLLFRWRGSIWKSVKSELLLWIVAFYSIQTVYRYLLTDDQKVNFGKIAKQCDKQLDWIPLTFMLGFFVTIIVDRWRQIFTNMGWIENVALTISAVLQGDDKKVVLQRRAIIRYCVLAQVLVFRDISMRVRRRFPTLHSLVLAGFLTEEELLTYKSMDFDYNKYWAPINWALSICHSAHKEGNLVAPPSLNSCINEIRTFRTNLALLCNFDWVPIPIAYPQVVFLAVRVYFIICLVSRQYISSGDGDTVDMIVPFMTILQFIFFVGWMKVAEALLNPLGEDDDDFECNFLIDKNIATGMAIVDQTHNFHPPLVEDKFMNSDFAPVYSEESTRNGVDAALVGSAAMAEPKEEVVMVAVDPKISNGDLSDFDSERSKKVSFDSRARSTTDRMRRRFSSAFNGNKHRSHSVQPVDLGISLPANFNLTPERPVPHSPFNLSHDLSPKFSQSTNHILTKVDEEEVNPSPTHSRSVDSTDDDDEVHDIIKNECNPKKPSHP